jgi:hypothetical protein
MNRKFIFSCLGFSILIADDFTLNRKLTYFEDVVKSSKIITGTLSKILFSVTSQG